MTPADDLKVGMHVAIVACKKPRTTIAGFFPIVTDPEDERFDGKPLRILEISLPFLAVTDGARVFAIDLRAWDVKEVSSAYAEAMQLSAAVAAKGSSSTLRRKKKDNPDPKQCPNCKDRMVERLLTLDKVWILICPTCGFNAGPAPSSAA